MAFSVSWLVMFLGGRQCTVTTASFQILTTALNGMSIYTYPMALGQAVDALDLPNTFQSLSQPSLYESEVLSAQLSVGAV